MKVGIDRLKRGIADLVAVLRKGAGSVFHEASAAKPKLTPPPAARGDPAPRWWRTVEQHRPQLQRPLEHNFTADGVTLWVARWQFIPLHILTFDQLLPLTSCIEGNSYE
jgi:hypothetical protein